MRFLADLSPVYIVKIIQHKAVAADFSVAGQAKRGPDKRRQAYRVCDPLAIQ